MRIKIFAIVALFIGIVMLSLTSCTSDEEPISTQSNSDTQRAKISFQVSTSSYDATRADTEEADNQMENYINPYSNNYRVYFYDTNNVYIAELENTELTIPGIDMDDYNSVHGYDGNLYCITGDVPDELKSYTDFKVVVIANWMDGYRYEDYYSKQYPAIEQGSTIEDLCQNSTNSDLYTNVLKAEDISKDCHDGYAYSSGWGYFLFPFYGVHEYKNISFNANGTTTLEGIDLLRAFAKVQIKYDYNYGYTTMNSFPFLVYGNNYCSCAPLGVYSQDGYSSRKLNCIESLTLYEHWGASKWSDDSEKDDCGVAYLAEYDNHNSNTPAMIMFLTAMASGSTDYAPIYFAEYDEDGKTTAYDDDTDANKAKRWDIVRNTLYKFEVTYVDDVSGARAIDPSIKKSSNTPNIKVKSERIELK